jgi:hypothetical protein
VRLPSMTACPGLLLPAAAMTVAWKQKLQVMEHQFKYPRIWSLQEEFYRLESRLQTAYMMLLAAMGVQDQVRRYASKAE